MAIEPLAVSFLRDIRPLFREVDVQHMSPLGVLLADYGYMGDPTNNHQNARDIYAYLNGSRKPRMPIGGPFWSQSSLDLYLNWMNQGYNP
jgi:hypothetical protein